MYNTAMDISRLFLRAMAVVYFTAFGSLAVQILGLVGSEGILPAGKFLQNVKAYYGPVSFGQAPTLFWVSHSDWFLAAVCWAGCGLAVMLFLGILVPVTAFGLWAMYLSLTVVGQDFLGFQWDNLLLESGFLLIFLYPLRLSLQRNADLPSVIIIWLLRWVLFRLMFSSGLVKILSHDPAWWQLEGLTHHYLTQPLPHVLSWYVHQLPDGFHKLSCVGMFVVELVVPFAIFFGRPARQLAFWILILFQLLILLTGNYTFFNILSMALCLTLLLDGRRPSVSAHDAVAAAVALIVCGMTTALMLGRHMAMPEPVRAVVQVLSPLRTFNNYGLFAVMTTQRREIIIEGSHDGRTWLAYEFYWKPGDVARMPQWVQPHQPRLDWQMWFAALGSYERNLWFTNLAERLLTGSKPVLALLKTNPFKDHPPRFIRSSFYDYRFTDPGVQGRTKEWWQRQSLGLYSPVMSLKE